MTGYERTATPQQAADEIGVDEKTIRRWCAEPGYHAPHERDARTQQIRVNIDELRQWMRRAGRSGEPGRPDEYAGVADAAKFWLQYREIRPPDWEAAADDDGEPSDDVLTYPDDLITPFERSVVDGSRAPTARETKQYVKLAVRLRAILLWETTAMTSWLVRRDENELEARLLTIMGDKIGWFEERINELQKGRGSR